MPNKLTISDMQDLAKEKDFILLSKEYIGSRSPLSWKCKTCKLVFTRNQDQMKQKGGCPKCLGKLVYTTLKDVKVVAKEKGLECLATEFIDYDTNYAFRCGKMHDFSSNLRGYLSCPICKKKRKITLDKIKGYAAARGGTCLSKKYSGSSIHHLWKCNNPKHTAWKAVPDNIRRGQWCPMCRSDKMRLPIETLQEKARQNKGELLSTESFGYNHQYLWRCRNGHEFLKTW
ncbi:MAG: hypothetical protein OCD00_16450, partial [Colwellia sp.]